MSRVVASLFLLTVATAAPAVGTRAGSAAAAGSTTALNWAFRFATEVSDAKDRARAQESAVDAYVDLGRLDEAERLAGQIEGWRKGVAWAKVAEVHAREGRADVARRLADRAEGFAAGVQGWGRDRVLAEVAEVRALLGVEDRAREIAERLVRTDTRTYEGRGAATIAFALAASGDLDGAMAQLRTLDGNDDLYVAWWRTEGFLRLAERPGIEADRRGELLAAARSSADGIDGWKRAEILIEIAAAFDRAGSLGDARKALEIAEEQLSGLPKTMSLKGPLLADLARAWSEVGERERARRMMVLAEAEIGNVSSVVERPAVIARIATAYAALGVDADADRLLGEAIDRAQALVNSRPRALALSAICREMGRRGLAVDDALRERLDTLLAGLRAPA